MHVPFLKIIFKLSATGFSILNRRTFDRAKTAEHATVSGLGL